MTHLRWLGNGNAKQRLSPLTHSPNAKFNLPHQASRSTVAIVSLLGWLAGLPGVAQTTSDRAMGDRSAIAQAASNPAVCPAQLGGAIRRVTARLPQVQWGILIQPLAQPPSDRSSLLAPLFAQNAETAMIPASNNKLLTTAAALTQLGASYRFRTVVYGDRQPPDLARLRIVGQGDPSLTTASLTTIAQQLRQRGVRQIAQLVGDDTYFRGAAINPTWEPKDTLAGYGAAVNSLMLNQNAIGLTLYPQQVGQPLRVAWDDPTDRPGWQLRNRSLTVEPGAEEFVDVVRDPRQWIIQVDGQLQAGSAAEPVAVSVPNPGNYLVQKFRTLLAANQIGVSSATVIQQSLVLPEEIELAAIESAPLAQLLVETNRESNNIYAEALLKTTGRTQFPTAADTTQSGIAAVKAVLTPLGINPAHYTMADGSGLSDRNRVAPAALVQLLQVMAQQPDAAVFRASLPVAGINGTLKNRFRDTIAQGKVQAKTGTISGVVALSGYAVPPNYPPLVFSILTNTTDASPTSVRQTVDELVLLLMRLRSC